jgi:DNA-binding PadR family transcriptional regulator
MPKSVFVGEFEQLVLLCLLRLGDRGYALPLRRKLNEVARRKVSRGALYRTLERLESKGYLTWEVEEAVARRGGHARRRYTVTETGLDALRASRHALLDLWEGLEEVLQ